MHLRAQFGKWGEDMAVTYLEQRGYGIVARNYRTSYGEIDIVACQGRELIFVEVKARKTLAFGYPAAAVTKLKQDKIHKAAFSYLASLSKKFSQIRFDVIEIYYVHGEVTINHLQHCF